MGFCAQAPLAEAAPGAQCEAPRPYVGRPLHATPPPAELPGAGTLEDRFDTATTTRLDAGFKTAFASARAHAMTAAVAVPGQGLWTAQQGGEWPLFYWASAGKQATAVVVLQLVEAGRLNLSDPVSRWVSGVPNGDAITVEHLLSHTSGLPSANEDPGLRGKSRPASLQQELAILRRHGAQFCPGEAWRYSNSGYALLGRIIERVDGRPLHQAITDRIITPLGLSGMRAIGPRLPASEVAPPTSDGLEPAIDIAVAGAAGPIVASAPDMVRFEQAVLNGTLLKPQTIALMLRRLYPMFAGDTSYGLGVMVYYLPDPPGQVYWIGHSGGAPGVKAVVAYAPRQGAFVAVALTGDGSAHAAANLLLKAIAP